MSRTVKKLPWKEYIDQFDPSIREAIANARKKPGVTGIATLQCEVLDSSRCGQLTALIYGEPYTYKSLEHLIEVQGDGGIYPTGLPSSASFVVSYTEDLPPSA